MSRSTSVESAKTRSSRCSRYEEAVGGGPVSTLEAHGDLPELLRRGRTSSESFVADVPADCR